MADSPTPPSERSIPYFRHSKVSSCTQVIMRNGQPVALPYHSQNPNAKLLYNEKSQSTQKRSISHDSHRIRHNLHAGMKQKPLARYVPDAPRSRLKTQDFIVPYKNTSQIVIGDRSRQNRRHFVTTAQNLLKLPQFQFTTNPGIISEKTKWKKYKQWS